MMEYMFSYTRFELFEDGILLFTSVFLAPRLSTWHVITTQEIVINLNAWQYSITN